MTTALEIPKITDERLAKLARKIKPVIRNAGNALCYLQPGDLRIQSFTWGKIDRKATGLVKHATIRTLHTWSYYGFFKPSVAEVLAQIPEELIADTVAFETIGPADAAAMNKESEALNAGFHVAATRLYARSA